MIRIPEALIALLTFPGVMVHELAHKKFCDWFGVAVHKVAYFRLQNPFSYNVGILGYVIHEEPKTFGHTFWISTGPLIFNSFVAILCAYVATRFAHGLYPRAFFYWMAISIGAHAFPSSQDAKNVLDRSRRHIANGGSILHYLSYPFFWLTCYTNRLRKLWLDFVYAGCLVYVASHL